MALSPMSGPHRDRLTGAGGLPGRVRGRTSGRVDLLPVPQPVAVEARDLTKSVLDGRQRRTVIDRVSFVVARGELVVLRGPSGSGKTTLLALLGAMRVEFAARAAVRNRLPLARIYVNISSLWNYIDHQFGPTPI